MNGHWIELGDNSLVRVADISVVWLQGAKLRIRLRGSAVSDDYTHASEQAARDRYNFIREALGFTPRAEVSE